MSLNRITSSGVFVGATANLGAPRTYVILGVPRGGTSMCAGALRLAGVPMGTNITEDAHEDREFLAHRGDVGLFERPDARERYVAELRDKISTRNQEHDVWGWKDPISALYLDDILGDLRNPHLILVLRDPAAAAMREWSVVPQSHLGSTSRNFYFDQIERTLSFYSRAIKVVRAFGGPGLIVSYERTLRNPEDFANRILAFTGMTKAGSEAEQDLAKKIVSYVKPDAVSGRLSNKRDSGHRQPIKRDLSFYGSIDDAYRACADLVNSGEYSGALTLSASILMAGVDGGRVAPQFVLPPQRFAVIEAGLSFIRAVAFTNTADPARALKEVLRFKAATEYLGAHGIEDPLVENLRDPVARLQQSLETSLFGASFGAP